MHTHLQLHENPAGEKTGNKISFRTTQYSPRISYYLHSPQPWQEGQRVLVAVHGISFNAAEHAMHFSRLCQQHGLMVVAPVFSSGDFPGYQRLGLRSNQPRPRADLALNAILDDVAQITGADTSRCYMFGYSGGGQFVHRYALLHPRRVIRAALGAPGWYTFPNAGIAYPRGLRLPPLQEPGVDLSLNDYLRVPMAVFVGEHDCYRDPALNTSPRIDRQQGYTRADRGQRWTSAMRRSARAAGLNTPYEFSLLEDCGHSFLDCMVKGRLGPRALDFLLNAEQVQSPRHSDRIRNWTVFTS